MCVLAQKNKRSICAQNLLSVVEQRLFARNVQLGYFFCFLFYLVLIFNSFRYTDFGCHC